MDWVTTDDAMRSLAVYVSAAVLAVLAGFAPGFALWPVAGLKDGGGGAWHRFLAGDAAVWTALLAIGLLLGGKRLLWLLVAAPFTLLIHVALLVVVVLVALTAWS